MANETVFQCYNGTQRYLLASTGLYERVGDVRNMAFPSSAVVTGERLRLYYDCADTCISIADASLKDIITYIKANTY